MVTFLSELSHGEDGENYDEDDENEADYATEDRRQPSGV